MLNKILNYGLVAGAIVAVPTCLMTVTTGGHPPLVASMIVGYLTMLIAFSTIFVAVKRRRDSELGGIVRFWPAFALGLGISVVASVIYVAVWEAVQALAHLDFANSYARTVIAEQQAKGVSGAALAKVTAEMAAFRVQYADPLYRLPMTFIEIFPVGVLVSLVSAGLLSNRRFLAARRIA